VEKRKDNVGDVVHQMTTDLLDADKLDVALEFLRELVDMHGMETWIMRRTYSRLLNEFLVRKKTTNDLRVVRQFVDFIYLMHSGKYQILQDIGYQFQILHMASLVGCGAVARTCMDMLRVGPKPKGFTMNVGYGLLLKALFKEAHNKRDYSNQEQVLECLREMIDARTKIYESDVQMVIENAVCGGVSIEATRNVVSSLREDMVVTKFTAKKKDHVAYLDLLARIEPFLRCGNHRAAHEMIERSQFFSECNRFIRTYARLQSTIVAEETDYIVSNLDDGLGTISDIQEEGCGCVNLIVNGVISELVKGGRFEEAVHFTKGVVVKDGVVVEQQVVEQILNGFIENRNNVAVGKSDFDVEVEGFAQLMIQYGGHGETFLKTVKTVAESR